MLKGRRAFITGTNRGIGWAILEEFARNGADLIAHARRETPEFIQACDDLASAHGVRVMPLFFDMRDSIAMKEAVKGLLSSKTPVDILVNNAAVAHFGLFQMTSMAKIRELFDINLFAQMELTQLLLRPLARRKGCIINMGSTMGLDLPQGSCAYGLSKAALMAFTQTLAAECGPLGIRVNALAPGLVDTEMADQMGDNARDVMVAQCALRRTASPEEVARAAAYLVSSGASYVNGQILRVDGGKA